MGVVITNAGLAGLASTTNGAGGEAPFTYIALGTGTTDPAVTDTVMEAEIVDTGLERDEDPAPSRETTAVANDTSVTAVSFTATGSKPVTEIGLLNAAVAGTLGVHATIAVINLDAGDVLIVRVKIQNTR